MAANAAGALGAKTQPRFRARTLRVRSFFIGLNIKDQDIIFHINSFFSNKGRISTYLPHNEIRITFDNLDVRTNYVIPHFDSYPLLGIKHFDYILFKTGINLINKSEYKNIEGFVRKFSKLAILMNEGYKKNIIKLFPDLINLDNNFNNKFANIQSITGLTFNPIINPIINPWCLTGFIDGDGSFSASIKYKNLAPKAPAAFAAK